MSNEETYFTRSRGGCWTCRRQHRKCDEKRPACHRCQRLNKICEGYSAKYVWKNGGMKNATSGASATAVDNTSRPDQARDTRGSEVFLHPSSPDDVPPLGTTDLTPESPSQTLSTSVAPLSVVDNDLEMRILTEFCQNGYTSLGERGLSSGPLTEGILPLVWTYRSVARVCLAYQAYKDAAHRAFFPSFLQEALELYKSDLNSDEIAHVSTLVTGITLCSDLGRNIIVGNSHSDNPGDKIRSLLLWTVHLNGLEVMITQRGLHHTSEPRDNLPQYLLEVCGLLDMRGFTVGRRNPCKQIWERFVAPIRRTGIEPTSGLPRSLLDIQARIEHPDTGQELLLWVPEKAEHVIQYNFWEAFRLGSLLLHRSVTDLDKNSPADGMMGGETESLIMRILSNVRSLRDAPDDPFRTPLRRCVIFPLWIAGLHTEAGSHCRAMLSREFELFIAERGYLADHTAWEILLEVWSRRESGSNLSPFDIADQFANELEIELHLY